MELGAEIRIGSVCVFALGTARLQSCRNRFMQSSIGSSSRMPRELSLTPLVSRSNNDPPIIFSNPTSRREAAEGDIESD